MYNYTPRTACQMYAVYFRRGPAEEHKTNKHEGIVDFNEATKRFGVILAKALQENTPGLVVLENTTEGYIVWKEAVQPRNRFISEETKQDIEDFNRIFGSH
jgi:hypothetical protein